jgi:hypothetical protein
VTGFDQISRSQTRRDGAGGAESAAGSRTPDASRIGRLLRLQGQIGNQAFQRYVLSPPSPTVQRYAFVKEAQVKRTEPTLTSAMKTMVKDKKIRNYDSLTEFKDHSSKGTDYLGSLADGTWLRFNPTGTNILGENHTEITLEKIVHAVGTTSFIYEPFSSDNLAPGSQIKAAYEKENKARFKSFGINKKTDKQPYGAESLFPKMGYGLTLALPYFQKTSPIADLKSGPGKYTGQPIQRYLKIAWAYSMDNVQSVAALKKASQPVGAKMDALATLHAALNSQLNEFITKLKVDGFIGDPLSRKKNAALFAPLAQFAQAFTDAMIEMAATEASSRLPAAKRTDLLKPTTTASNAEKDTIFSDWRNFKFEDSLNDAITRGVRYAGMGNLHLDHLTTAGLPPNTHGFDMTSSGAEMTGFKALTTKLKGAAVKP